MRVIMLSMHGDRRAVYESLKAGAGGYLLKAAAFPGFGRGDPRGDSRQDVSQPHRFRMW